MMVYVCEPWLEGTLCGVYNAQSDPAGHENARLAVKGKYEELKLFTKYRGIQVCPGKAEKVIRSVCAKLFQEMYRKVYTASLSRDREQADKIYGSLIQVFRHGPSVLDILQLPACYDIFSLHRNVYNENHLLTEFLRLSETPGGVLVLRIDPRSDIMTLLAPHFADRLPEEDWIIRDKNHKRAAAHPAGRS